VLRLYFFCEGGNPVTVKPTPTGREQDILKVLWEDGPCSVRAVFHRLAAAQEKDLAYNTVQTLLRLMEDKGLVTHHVEGRTFIYTPDYSREDSAAGFLDRVFDGAADELVQSLLRAEKISPKELERLHTLIAQARRTTKRGDKP
jgi:BlaI family transcriptional regulator, penicillinase repressor